MDLPVTSHQIMTIAKYCDGQLNLPMHWKRLSRRRQFWDYREVNRDNRNLQIFIPFQFALLYVLYKDICS